VNPLVALFNWISQFWRSRKKKNSLILKDLYRAETKTARIVRVLGANIPGVVVVFRLTPPAPASEQLAIHLVDIGRLRQQSQRRNAKPGTYLPGTGRMPYEQDYRQWCDVHNVDPSHTTHVIFVAWLVPSYDAKRKITRPIETIPGNLQHPYQQGNLGAIAITQKLALQVARLPDVPNAGRPWQYFVDRFEWIEAIERLAESDFGKFHVFQRKTRR